jgi:hypothetical protein
LDVTVTTAGGTSATSSADQFAYLAASSVTLTAGVLRRSAPPVGPLAQSASMKARRAPCWTTLAQP